MPATTAITTRPLANVSIDLDGLGCYHQIHSLAPPADPVAIYTTALPRFLDLFEELGVRCTLFAIGRDLAHPRAAAALAAAVERGHEVASHTWSHPYNLRDWSKLSVAEELDRAADAIRGAVGVHPVGFRTPGYNVSTRIVHLLAERGYRYDSSVLASPAYYAAKGAVMTAMALRGRPSGSSLVDSSTLSAPIQPYRPSRWDVTRAGDRKHSMPIWEIPIGVTPGTRLPVIGTSVCALPAPALSVLYRSFRFRQRTLQLELHGIDLLASDDQCVHLQLSRRQPDLRRSWQKKRESLRHFIQLMMNDYAMVTLETMVDELDAAAGPTVVV